MSRPAPLALRRKIVAYGAIVLAAGAILTANDPAAAAGRDPRSPRLRQALVGPVPMEGLRVSVVLREPQPASSRAARRAAIRSRQERVLAGLPRGRFEERRRYRALSGFSGWAQPDAIERLAADPDVVSIYLDRRMHKTLSQGTARVGADTGQGWGFDGNGVVVAVLDSGIDTDHPQLDADIAGEACFCDDSSIANFGCCPNNRNTQTGAGAAEDDDGHGTSVAGIVTSPSGVAPAAKIVAVKVLDDNGTGNFSDLAKGLDWVITDGIPLGVQVVNISIGDNLEHDDDSVAPCTGSLTAMAIEELHQNDVSVFVSSGNNGYDSGISFPACSPHAISVGGVYDSSMGNVSWCAPSGCPATLCTDTGIDPDDFVCHSNSGSLLDMLAPDWRTTTTTMGGGTGLFGGTSAASPYAAGMAALLVEASPSLDPESIRDLLQLGAPLVVNPDNASSYPRARVNMALATLNVLCGDGYVDPGEACDDGNPSGVDCCDAACQLVTAGTACEDGDACTTGSTCDGSGVCTGAVPLSCDDANDCTNDFCNASSGCYYTNRTGGCQDGNACTSPDICSNGVCIPGGPVGCEDFNVCTDDSCDPASGCVFAPNTAPCVDNNFCTLDDVCVDGVCTTGPTPYPCDDSEPCTDDACDMVLGCLFTPNTAPCDDSDACTAGDVCSGGTCTGGAPLVCEDGDVCTDDSCDPASGCVFAHNSAPCDDADACTSSDVCSAGSCTSTALACDDGDACTADGCDGVTGCFHQEILGCRVPLVPSISPWGALLLAIALAGGAGLAGRRADARGPRGTH